MVSGVANVGALALKNNTTSLLMQAALIKCSWLKRTPTSPMTVGRGLVGKKRFRRDGEGDKRMMGDNMITVHYICMKL